MPLRYPSAFPCAFVLLVLAFPAPAAAQSAQNPLQLRPDHATAAVADVDRAIRWYQEVLGFTIVNRGERADGARSADLEIPGYGIGLVQIPGRVRSGAYHAVRLGAYRVRRPGPGARLRDPEGARR